MAGYPENPYSYLGPSPWGEMYEPSSGTIVDPLTGLWVNIRSLRPGYGAGLDDQQVLSWLETLPPEELQELAVEYNLRPSATPSEIWWQIGQFQRDRVQTPQDAQNLFKQTDLKVFLSKLEKENPFYFHALEWMYNLENATPKSLSKAIFEHPNKNIDPALKEFVENWQRYVIQQIGKSASVGNDKERKQIEKGARFPINPFYQPSPKDDTDEWAWLNKISKADLKAISDFYGLLDWHFQEGPASVAQALVGLGVDSVEAEATYSGAYGPIFRPTPGDIDVNEYPQRKFFYEVPVIPPMKDWTPEEWMEYGPRLYDFGEIKPGEWVFSDEPGWAPEDEINEDKDEPLLEYTEISDQLDAPSTYVDTSGTSGAAVPNLPTPTVPTSAAAPVTPSPAPAPAAPVREVPYQGRPGLTYNPDAGMEMAARQRPTRRGW